MEEMKQAEQVSLGISTATDAGGVLYPGADPAALLDKQLFYQLDDADIAVGLNFLQQKRTQNCLVTVGSERRFLMPMLFRILSPDDEQFVDMGFALSNLLRDAAKDQTVRTVIGGIMNVNANHYINYFISLDPTHNSVKVFILDPMADSVKASKKVIEKRYGELLLAMLQPSYPDEGQLTYEGFSVSQQLGERDCGFLSFQNLEDFLIGDGIFEVDYETGVVKPRPAGLSLKGNDSKVYNEEQQEFAYSPLLRQKAYAIRAVWAERLGAVKEFAYHSLKSETTLADAIGDSVAINPYDYQESVNEYYRTNCQNQVRDKAYGIFCGLQNPAANARHGRTILDRCSSRFIKDFALPSRDRIAQYANSLKAAIERNKIEIYDHYYSSSETGQILGSLENFVSLCILDDLKSQQQEAFCRAFGKFAQNYQWIPVPQNPAELYDAFFAQESTQAVIQGFNDRHLRQNMRDAIAREFDHKIQSHIVNIEARLREAQQSLDDLVEAGQIDNEGVALITPALSGNVNHEAMSAGAKGNALKAMGQAYQAKSSPLWKALGVALIALGSALALVGGFMVAVSLGVASTGVLAPLGGVGFQAGAAVAAGGLAVLVVGVGLFRQNSELPAPEISPRPITLSV